MKATYLYIVLANDAPGILSQILGMFNRRRYPIESVTASQTNRVGEVAIVIESLVPVHSAISLRRQVEKVIEVVSVQVVEKSSSVYRKAAIWKLNKDILSTPQGWVVEKFQPEIVNMNSNSILICKCGNEDSLTQLHDALKGEHLLGYAETGLISEQALHNDDEVRISRLAA